MNCVQIFLFLIGYAIGLFTVFIFYQPNENGNANVGNNLKTLDHRLTQEELYNLWFRSNGFKSRSVSSDELSFSTRPIFLESTFLFRKVKVICVIFVNVAKNAYAIKNSWGNKCNKLYMFSKEEIQHLQIRKLTQRSSWHQLCDIIREIWFKEIHLQWVLFAPDNVYVIPENLRYLVAYRDPERPYYLGHSSLFWNQVYNSGETAYVLSRGAIRKLILKFNSSDECSKGGKYRNNEDYLLGKHLSEMGVRAEDTRDEFGRSRFHLNTAAQLMAPGSTSVLVRSSKRSLYPVTQGANCCSPSTISFKAIQDDCIIYYNYLLYNVKLFIRGNLGNRLSNNRTVSLEAAENFIHQTLGKGVNLSSVSSDLYFELWKLNVNDPEKFNEKIREEQLQLQKIQ